MVLRTADIAFHLGRFVQREIDFRARVQMAKQSPVELFAADIKEARFRTGAIECMGYSDPAISVCTHQIGYFDDG
jgi:hypothetical protein